VINRELRDLVEGHPALHEAIPFERRGGWSSWARLLKTLALRRFDMTIDLQGLLRTGVMTVATGASVRVGLETAREGSKLTLNCVVSDTARELAAHARYWRIAEVLGLSDMPRETFVATSSADRDWAREQFARLPRPIFSVHPGAKWVTKRWPVSKFAELLAQAMQSWPGSVVILGSPSERAEADQLEHELGQRPESTRRCPVVNLVGKTSLKQLSALLPLSDFAISNDSGPMHLAAGLGTPTLGIFTCTSAYRSGPAGAQHEMVSTTVPCAASYHKTCPHSGEQHMACLRELDVDRVWRALSRLVLKNQLKTRVA
jgi:lipopolysaccharide heptosyltransferase II